jgi:hypothetical protein
MMAGARPGNCNPNKTRLQRRLRPGCNDHVASESRILKVSSILHINQAATANVLYRMAQTGPRTQSEGVHSGMLRLLHQPFNADIVMNEPTAVTSELANRSAGRARNSPACERGSLTTSR